MLEQAVWIAVGTVMLVAGSVVLWDFVKSLRRRKSRALHYQRMSTSQPMQLPVKPSDPGMGQERLDLIRMEAENAARMAFVFPGQKAANPYPQGTREFVLWTASYHLVFMELCEAKDTMVEVPGSKPP